ncbi:AAA family ATPase [Nonomuraea turcica]|uniref:AAA family ATPase n=1 Tax=Nonomuraea sp. G32 TaxID=3067274 RepID=UPI00273CBAA8|nr:AAA family ATPase [Nonomuraea sp. G32]MDP4508202.1 AAA family ATPase [Nonomuraea sp. G32]
MRPHRLTLTAFGSFPGTETVDFDALAEAGLFLVHGPTGAGKTTILDALCFALYGQVPGQRNSARSLRCDHAPSSAGPSVTLEVSIRGRLLRIQRSPSWQRPKLRGTGFTEEKAKVVVSERHGTSWHGLTTRLDEAGDLVGGLLGMNADQFWQVAMLPQGDFAKFLRADGEERAKLLERLFTVKVFTAAESWLAEQRKLAWRAAQDLRQQVDFAIQRVEEAAGDGLRTALTPATLAPTGPPQALFDVPSASGTGPAGRSGDSGDVPPTPDADPLRWAGALLDAARAAVVRTDEDHETAGQVLRAARLRFDQAAALADRQRRYGEALTARRTLDERADERADLQAILDDAARADRVMPLITATRQREEAATKTRTMAADALSRARPLLSSTLTADAQARARPLLSGTLAADAQVRAGLLPPDAPPDSDASSQARPLVSDALQNPGPGLADGRTARAGGAFRADDADRADGASRACGAGRAEGAGRADGAERADGAFSADGAVVGTPAALGAPSVSELALLERQRQAEIARLSELLTEEARLSVVRRDLLRVEAELAELVADDDTVAARLALLPGLMEQAESRLAQARADAARIPAVQAVRDAAADLIEVERELAGLAVELDALAQREAEASAADAELPERVADAGAALAQARAQAAAIPAASADLDAARAALEATHRRDALAAELDAAAAAHQVLVDHAQTLRERWLDLRQARMDGMAAELARDLADGRPCAVCGSDHHPQPASPAPSAPSADDEREAEDAHEVALAEREAAERALASLESRHAAAVEATGGLDPDSAEAAVRQAEEELARLQAVADREPALAAALDRAEAERERVRDQTREIAEALAAQHAHRTRLATERARLRSRLTAGLDAEVHTATTDLGTEIHTATTDLGTEIHTATADLDAEIHTVTTGLDAEIHTVTTGLDAEAHTVTTGLDAEIHTVTTGLDAEAHTVTTGLDAEAHTVTTGLDAEIHTAIDGIGAVTRSVADGMPSAAKAVQGCGGDADVPRPPDAGPAPGGRHPGARDVRTDAGGELDGVAVLDAAERELGRLQASARGEPRLAQEAAGLGRERSGLEEQGRRVAARLAACRTRHEELSGDAARLGARLDTARGDDTTITARLSRLGDEAELLREALEATQAAVAAADELDRARRQAQEAALAAGFADVPDAQAAYRNQAEREDKAERLRRLDDEHAAVTKTLADPELAAAAAEPVPDLAAIGAERDGAEAAYTRLASARDRAAARARRLEELHGELTACVERWRPAADRHRLAERMAALAGGTSSDNQWNMSLTSYVLGERLRQVVDAANERLDHMSAGRYLLRHDLRKTAGSRGRSGGGLGLRVADGWTGVDRDPATLSGGESFITSLALALGLADVVTAEAGGAEIGTLFVDEGFGTLDEDTLDGVLDILDGLRDGGRAVGIVSHVAELRSRITAQLKVTKTRTGSTLAAIGVG